MKKFLILALFSASALAADPGFTVVGHPKPGLKGEMADKSAVRDAANVAVKTCGQLRKHVHIARERTEVDQAGNITVHFTCE